MLRKIKNKIQSFFIKQSLKKNPKQAIVMIDGGICSQIHQWRIGEALRAKGVDVEYDISWFKAWGKDCDGKFARNFDLLTAFPNLEFKVASDAKIKYFQKHFSYTEKPGTSFLDEKMPKYFGSYYESYWKDLPPFPHQIDDSLFDSYNKNIARQIKKEPHAIGIHVRRGDMSVTKHNWVVCPPEYFVNAVKFFVKKFSNASFYFFSDEPDWIQDNILPLLKDIDNSIHLVSHNGSDKGYIDLALLSYCEHCVASQGNLGRYANMLNQHKDKMLIMAKEPGSTEIRVLHNLSDVIPNPVIK
ncbi:MAG: alpha-1,2-fucosyltransferase [Alphaproteobacteria bacterium]|nr:alpha-1,2-fucosyltransferase [Alphaproteobacteria bacterium]